jgi:hypothetical protein
MKRTKKWESSFEKRYSKVIKELQELENEYKMVKSSDENWPWYTLYPEDSLVDFGENYRHSVRYVRENQYQEDTPEHVEVTINSELGAFSFDFQADDLKKFRNSIIEEYDKMKRENSPAYINTNECEEEDEDWENNEESEYTIQCSRTAVQTWTHTVMARSVCEAYRKAEEGEGHDENDDFDDYGDIDYELI